MQQCEAGAPAQDVGGPATAVRRRGALATVAAWWVAPAWAQVPGRNYRLGWLGTTSPTSEPYNEGFVRRLAELGYVEGRNLEIVVRRVQTRDQLPAATAEIERARCDVIFAPGTEFTLRAALAGTRDTPIAIVATDYDPLVTGAVATLVRPGGRVTGLSLLQDELPGKRLQLLRELLPKVRRIGVMSDAATAGQLASTRAVAAQLGVDLVVHEFGPPPHDFATAFATFVNGRAEALVSLGSAFFVPGRQRIPELALRHRLPSIFHNALWAEHGGLVSYGPDFQASFRRAAEIVAKLLAGARPAETAIEQPGEVQLVLNLKTARALGVTFPPTLRARADRMVE